MIRTDNDAADPIQPNRMGTQDSMRLRVIARDQLVRACFRSLAGEHLLHEFVISTEKLDHEPERIREFQLLEVLVDWRRRIQCEFE